MVLHVAAARCGITVVVILEAHQWLRMMYGTQLLPGPHTLCCVAAVGATESNCRHMQRALTLQPCL